MAAARKGTAVPVERLAVIEAQFAAHAAADAAGFARIESALQRLESSVGKMDDKIGSQRGFIAGAAFVISTVWAVVIGVLAYWPFGK